MKLRFEALLPWLLVVGMGTGCSLRKGGNLDGGEPRDAGGATDGKAGTGGGHTDGSSTDGKAGAGGGRTDGSTIDTAARRDAMADRKSEVDVPDGQTLTSGSACAADSQCASDHCVDGVCCESACGGQCQSCGESSNPGKCLTISGTPRGSLRAQCTGTAPCQSQCDGTNPTACTFPGSTAQCAVASCANGVVTSSTVCNGTGACSTATTTPCASNQCADNTKCSGGCSASQPCGSGKYCDTTGVCLAVKGNGTPCQSAAECSSAQCVDGVCCNVACAGQCQGCAETNSMGTCATITGAPRNGRAPCAGTAPCVGTCGSSATSCTPAGSSVICAAATCAGGSATPASVCNGAGACTTPTATACASNQCADTTKCSGGCSASLPCASGQYCTSSAICAPLKGSGSACQSGAECTSTNCVDGVCCNAACAGQCQGCAESGSVGVCVSVSGAPRSGRAPCAGTAPCVGSCNGSSGAACTFAGSSVTCLAASCAGGVATSATVCNGAGACTTAATMSCASNQCADTTKCSGGCSASLPCASGQYCTPSAACAPLKGNGTACQSGSECTSTSCVDGVCCNVACGGQCQACAESGSVGTCITVKGAPRGTVRAPCSGTNASCVGSCGGTSATQCNYPPSTTTCGSPSCSGGAAIKTPTCDGAGNCPTPSSTPCTPFICGATACLTTCTANSQCVTGAACVSGVCTACGSGQTVCSNACANLASTDANCGSCGHSCQGGGCSGSACQPEALNGQPISTYNLQGAWLSGSNVYILSAAIVGGGTYELWQIPTAGAAVGTKLCTFNENFGDMTVGNGSIFWVQADASGNGFDLVSTPLATCNPTAPVHVLPARSFGSDWVTNGPYFDPATTELVWLEEDSSAVPQKRVMRSTTAGSNVRMLTMFNAPDAFTTFTQSTLSGPTRLFWGTQQTSTHALFYISTNLSGATPVTVTSAAPGFGPGDILADDTTVVWSGSVSTGNESFVAPLPGGIAGGAAPPLFVPASGNVSLGLLDATSFYGYASVFAGSISKCAISGCSPALLVAGQSSVEAFLQDTTTLYWVNVVLGISPTDPSALSVTKLAK